jgi:hemoglobin
MRLARPALESIVNRTLFLFFRLSATAVLGAALCQIPAHAAGSLYDDLGQGDGISRIVKGLLVRVHQDPRTVDYFDGVSDKRLQDKLTELFCQLAGGPCTYTGHTMQQAHGGLHIDQKAFDALVEDLQDSMDENHVAYATQNRLLALLAPMSREVEGQ